MPLFNRHQNVETAPVVEEKPKRSSTLFGRRKETEVSPVRSTTTHHTTTTSSTSPHRRSGLLHRRDEDPTIIAARERVMNAEAAERDADRALVAARVAVKEAREHIKRLEKEAAEEARLARIKQDQAKSMSKRGHALGRHENH
ncbi:uncharacterized protein LY89DRAFT_686545 [Mollisia scopiformis]|uniref:Uncharacterized protein n=1 Tax=Mollisia scopiformis TaxID=149040 RepID=A0A194X4G6_MOLSC|nr:uncharacterized protein LY89DRAFT_686545 [Mollisia scopiformis]KUJ14949.1 hypothetical protein LY89DRAFT_686545 [Mollisia scopiformis]